MKRRRVLAAAALAPAGLAVALPRAAHAGAYEDFFRAIEVDNAGELRELLARGMDPNTRDPRGQTGLYLALRGGALQAATLLLQHPALEVDAANAAGETALMMAALRGHLAAMQALAGRGAALERPGWTPLHYAASGPSAEALQWLLERGARVDARSPNGNTALMLAARYGSENAVAMLLARGADRGLRNERQLNAADLARLDGRESLARRLEQGAR